MNPIISVRTGFLFAMVAVTLLPSSAAAQVLHGSLVGTAHDTSARWFQELL